MRQSLTGLGLPAVAALPAAASNTGALFRRTTDNTVWVSDGVNWFQVDLKASQKTQTVAASGAINTAETYICTPLQVAANQLKVGDKIRITGYGTCTTTAANLSTFTARAGASGVVADTAVGTLTGTAGTTGNTIAFKFVIDLVVRAIGASGSIQMDGQLTSTSVTGITNNAASVIIVGTTTAVNTTGALQFGVSYKTAVNTTTSTFQDVTVELIT